MKLEKINDNQIRCTLTKEDLEYHNIKLSEFAYGTDKARALFREMMQIAAQKLDFKADDIPLMIEAIPLSSESIILVITKVAYPEELDTRFSDFSDEGDEDYDEMGDDDIYEDMPFSSTVPTQKSSANDILESKDDVTIPRDLTRLFSFHSLDDIFHLSAVLQDYYHSKNSLYREGDTYYLVVTMGDHSAEEFNKVCNILTEYGNMETLSVGMDSYMSEHMTLISSDTALQDFARI
ncbi:MAG: adaptor protein MecA [Lachnospiraceae bacterium]|nr:adaptor protein MecA [Lachnospiraceae bacterium]